MPQLVPPPPQGGDNEDVAWQQFYSMLRKQANEPTFYAQSTDPGTAGVKSGTWSVWLNTTSNVLKLWANFNGTMRSVTLT